MDANNRGTAEQDVSMRISAIVPCFNGEQFLSQAIASVHAQTRPVAEIIVVDDNSTDGSAALAERLGALVIRLPKNVGPAEARNTGIRAAQGDVVAFLDADDAWMPHHCERTVGLLERFPSAVVAFGESSPMEGPQADGRLSPARRYTALEPFDALTVLLEENVVPQAAAVVRRDAILELGGYSPEFRYCEDYHLWLRLASVGAFVGAGEATLWRRTHPEQASHAVVAMRNGAWRARAAALGALPSTTAGSTPVRRALRDAWDLELQQAWGTGSTQHLDAALACHVFVPEATAAYRRWLLLRHCVWPVRQLVRRALYSLPTSLRSRILAFRSLATRRGPTVSADNVPE